MPFGNINSVPYDAGAPTAISKDKDSHLRHTSLSKGKHIGINTLCSPSVFLPKGFICLSGFPLM